MIDAEALTFGTGDVSLLDQRHGCAERAANSGEEMMRARRDGCPLKSRSPAWRRLPACALVLMAGVAHAQTQIFVGTSSQSGALVLSNFASKDADVL